MTILRLYDELDLMDVEGDVPDLASDIRAVLALLEDVEEALEELHRKGATFRDVDALMARYGQMRREP